MTDRLRARQEEFRAHVWNHAEDAFQVEFDTRRPLTDAEAAFLRAIASGIRDGRDDEAIAQLVKENLEEDATLTDVVLQLVGLTRNKILTDLNALGAKRGLRIPSDYRRLHTSREAWLLAGSYLASRCRKTLGPISILHEPEVNGALEALNQATWPGWIRQQRAKLQGHEAEYRLATLLASIGVPFEPLEKAENPLCPDIKYDRGPDEDSISFDLVVPSASDPGMVVKSSVHAANIGQYGESKTLEISEAADWLERRYPDEEKRPILFALVDGVGFNSNRAGLERVLSVTDEFCQFRTLWKAAVVASSVMGTRIELALPSDELESNSSFLDDYAEGIELFELDDEFRAEVLGTLLVPAGDGLIRAPDPKRRRKGQAR